MPLPKSKRQLIAEEALRRLRAIHTDDGFNTDAGELVFWGGPPILGEDDPDFALNLVFQDSEVQNHRNNVHEQLLFEVQALGKAGLEDAGVTVEAMVADVKAAIELDDDDRTFGGLLTRGERLQRRFTRSLTKEAGFTTVGTGVTYRAGYIESWGGGA